MSKIRCFCTKVVAAAVGSHKCAKNVRQAKWLNNAFKNNGRLICWFRVIQIRDF